MVLAGCTYGCMYVWIHMQVSVYSYIPMLCIPVGCNLATAGTLKPKL